MRFRDPNREIIEGSTRRVEFFLAPAVGANTIVGTPTLECSGLTFSGIAVSGTTLSTFVSGGQAGRDYIIKVTSILSSGETDVGAVTLEWKAAGFDGRTAA